MSRFLPACLPQPSEARVLDWAGDREAQGHGATARGQSAVLALELIVGGYQQSNVFVIATCKEHVARGVESDNVGHGFQAMGADDSKKVKHMLNVSLYLLQQNYQLVFTIRIYIVGMS